MTGQSSICSTFCSDYQQKPSKVCVTVPLWWESSYDWWIPTQRDSNMENALIVNAGSANYSFSNGSLWYMNDKGNGQHGKDLHYI